MRKSNVTIRPAKMHDLDAITEIYNEAILNSVATFDTQTKSIQEQKSWYTKHNSRYPILIAELDKLVVGWASLSLWSDRCAYADTAEISLYVSNGYRDKGIGRELLKTIIEYGGSAGLHTLIARVTQGNDVSLLLLESFGFKHIGTMKEVGCKFGRLLDVHLLQMIYPDTINISIANRGRPG
jgi:L-amino acid N-acyltransferase